MVGNDPPAGGSVIAESFWLPLFLVVVILTLRNHLVVRFLGDSKLQTGPTQFPFLLGVAVILFLALWKLVLYYFQMQKERIAKEIIYERERHPLIKMFESTGDVLPGIYSFVVIICFIIRKLIDTLLTQSDNNIQDDLITTRILKVPR